MRTDLTGHAGPDAMNTSMGTIEAPRIAGWPAGIAEGDPHMNELRGMSLHTEGRLPALPIYYVSNHRQCPETTIVLMPSALSNNRKDSSRPHFARLNWHTWWPRPLVLSISDPALQQSQELNGAWHVHPAFDVAEAISSIISEAASDARMPAERIVICDSSLGGFGAIPGAARLPGARAVAEVPQIDFERWLPSAAKTADRYILDGPIVEFRDKHPERLPLPARLSFAGLVPPLTIISNAEERTIGDQREFVNCCQDVALPRLCKQTL